MLKSDYRVKSKSESSKKSSANRAIEKARAFFRSFELRYPRHHRRSRPSSFLSTATSTDARSSYKLTSTIHQSASNDASLDSNASSLDHRTERLTSRTSKDLIIYRFVDHSAYDYRVSSAFVQQHSSQMSKPLLLVPREYFHEILTEPMSNEFLPRQKKAGGRSTLPAITARSNGSCAIRNRPHSSSFIYSSGNNREIALSKYRPKLDRAIESPLTWSQRVRRLNTEYRSTINALQQVKAYFQHSESNTASLRPDEIPSAQAYVNPSSKLEQRMTAVTTSDLITSNAKDTPPSSLLSSAPAEECTLSSSSIYVSPTALTRPMDLETLPLLSIVEEEDKKKGDPVDSMMQSFDALTNPHASKINAIQVFISPANPQKYLDFLYIAPINVEIVHPPSPNLPTVPDTAEEEITYSVETFYRSTSSAQNDDTCNVPHIVVIRESATEEQFNAAFEKSLLKTRASHFPPSLTDKYRDTYSSLLSDNSIQAKSDCCGSKASTDGSSTISVIPTASLVELNNQKNRAVSLAINGECQLSKRSTVTTHVSRLRPPSKIVAPVRSTTNDRMTSENTHVRKPVLLNSTRPRTHASLFHGKTHRLHGPVLPSLSFRSAIPLAIPSKQSVPVHVCTRPSSTSAVRDSLLLLWCQTQVVAYPNVTVTNLSSCWSNGLALCAMVHHFFPDAFDFAQLSPSHPEENFKLALQIAHERAGIARVLDISELLVNDRVPNTKSLVTYLHLFKLKMKDVHPVKRIFKA